ncbi:hypothetical protein CRG98_043044 [Punica granatum]|uniref:Uncharacterized protein n=1 Tax=Punica granatum TaxID=22663 RepID=A0A2I0HYE8_PUNGR|nr:hypothetical protein CRG98_043044 [Punica granatum]
MAIMKSSCFIRCRALLVGLPLVSPRLYHGCELPLDSPPYSTTAVGHRELFLPAARVPLPSLSGFSIFPSWLGGSCGVPVRSLSLLQPWLGRGSGLICTSDSGAAGGYPEAPLWLQQTAPYQPHLRDSRLSSILLLVDRYGMVGSCESSWREALVGDEDGDIVMRKPRSGHANWCAKKSLVRGVCEHKYLKTMLSSALLLMKEKINATTWVFILNVQKSLLLPQASSSRKLKGA